MLLFTVPSTKLPRERKRRSLAELLERRTLCHADDAPTTPQTYTELPVGPTTVNLDWTSKATLSLKRDEANGAALNGKLFVFGGFNGGEWDATRRVDAYDPKTDAWKQLRDMPIAVTHAAMAVQGKKVWMIGGFSGDNPGPSVSSVYLYDSTRDKYTAEPSLPSSRGGGAAAIVGDKLVFFGGNQRVTEADEVDSRSTYVMDLNDPSKGWRRAKAKLPTARNHVAGVTLGGNVYAIGGQEGTRYTAEDVDEVARYNPKLDRWTKVAPLPGATSHILNSTFVAGGDIFVLGGESSYNVSRASIYRYDADANTWSTYAQLPKARRSPIVGLFGDELVVTTGSYTGGIQTGDTIETKFDV